MRPVPVFPPEAVDYLVTNLMKRQQKQAESNDSERRAAALRVEIGRVVSAITAMGHSDALIATLHQKGSELRELSVAKQAEQTLDREGTTQFVQNAIQDVPKLLKKSPELAKAKLHQHVNSIRPLPQPDGA